MVIICRGRGQSVGGLGVEASRDKEQEEENINDGSSRCLCDQISELPEFLKLRYIQTFQAFFLYVFLCVFLVLFFALVLTLTSHWVFSFTITPSTHNCEKKNYHLSQGSSAILSYLYKY